MHHGIFSNSGLFSHHFELIAYFSTVFTAKDEQFDSTTTEFSGKAFDRHFEGVDTFFCAEEQLILRSGINAQDHAENLACLVSLSN
jgi:hypothetical protein